MVSKRKILFPPIQGIQSYIYRRSVLSNKGKKHEKSKFFIGITLWQKGNQSHNMVMDRFLLDSIYLGQNSRQGVVA